jgi:RNA polymerase sigma-70 factor, ECF subfamily
MAALFDEEAPLLLAVALRFLGGDHPAAEDLVHDVLVEAWKVTLARPSRAWLLARLRSRALERRSRGSPSKSEETFQSEKATAPAQSCEQWHHARAVIARLPVIERRVLETAYFEGGSVAAIASGLGISPGDARAHLGAALRALRSARGR